MEIIVENLPDVSRAQKTDTAGQISQVGMRNIEMPVLFVAGAGAPLMLPAKINAYVSLDDAEAKGIHMSRLYLELKNSLQQKPISPQIAKEILQKFLLSHKNLSEKSYLEIKFQVPIERKALVSGERGYRQYPFYLKAEAHTDGHFEFTLGTEVLYSSTCPCSAALARQLHQQAFLEKFQSQQVLAKSTVAEWLLIEGGAVPHSQRSLARVLVRSEQVGFVELIDNLEKALATPVQAAVKRVDEQEFAKINGQNLMFCEDAARKLKEILEEDARVGDYYIHVEHQESLHPHEAVSRVVKGVAGGFIAEERPSLVGN